MENQIRSFSLFVLSLSLTINSLHASSFPEAWEATQEGAYSSLPEYKTSVFKLFSNGVSLIANSAQRTLENDNDVLPHFQKLVHPIGICFAGTWKIDQASGYSGYFARGAEGLIIARASEAMGNGMKGEHRAFGIAGKLFPTTDPKDNKNYNTANFFTVDDLGGTKAESFLDLPKTNEPAITPNSTTVRAAGAVLSIIQAFRAADGNPRFRPVKQIAELGLDDASEARSPKYLMLQAESKPLSIHTNRGDFREELRLKNFPNEKLSFAILVAHDEDKHWVKLGKVELTQEALASGCDHRLHFPHPRLKD